MWATRRIGALLDRVRVEGETAALVDEIRDLGLSYGLVTPYTTFVVAAQIEGAASVANMALYGQADLNSVSGQTTVQARVQNQMYQQAGQSNLAAGANVLNAGHSSLAQVADVSIDLSLLRGQRPPTEPVTVEWLARNVGVDRYIVFGSVEYLALAQDPDARPFLQGGANVVFRYDGQVVAVQDTPAGQSGAADAKLAPSWLAALAREMGLRAGAAILSF